VAQTPPFSKAKNAQHKTRAGTQIKSVIPPNFIKHSHA